LIIKISSGFFCEEWANAASTAHSFGSSIFCGMVITCKGETVVAAETEQNLENLDKLESTKKSSIFPSNVSYSSNKSTERACVTKDKEARKECDPLESTKKGHARRTISVDRYGSSMSKKSNLSPLVKS
jgi:hypothetical protein